MNINNKKKNIYFECLRFIYLILFISPAVGANRLKSTTILEITRSCLPEKKLPDTAAVIQ